jgi:DNA-binding CsgD family transcriptional regulator
MLFSVLGGTSTDGLPAIVTRPGFVACLYCRWDPVWPTRYRTWPRGRAGRCWLGRPGTPNPALGHRVVILDASGSVTSVNDAAECWLAQIPESDWPGSSQLPVPLLVAAAAAGHDEAAPQHPVSAVRVRTVHGHWLPVHALALHGDGGRSTVLILEEPGPDDLASLILDSHGVTGAQARVVALVLRGYSTKQIVGQLAISQYTVQEHLRAVFDKLGVRSRQELAAALLRPGR